MTSVTVPLMLHDYVAFYLFPQLDYTHLFVSCIIHSLHISSANVARNQSMVVSTLHAIRDTNKFFKFSSQLYLLYFNVGDFLITPNSITRLIYNGIRVKSARLTSCPRLSVLLNLLFHFLHVHLCPILMDKEPARVAWPDPLRARVF